MARMYPDRLRSSTESAAERKLYQAFASQLPDDYHVFHSVAWQVPRAGQGAMDGEADFVIAHARLGLLVLEVKGGKIRLDGTSGNWFSNGHPIKDPFDQAKRNKYSLLALLKDQRQWGDRWIAIGHAVAFPDVTVSQDLRPDAPREIVMDGADVASLLPWVQRAMTHWRNLERRGGELGGAGLQMITEILRPSWDLRMRMGTAIRRESEEIRRLTEEQFHVLDILARVRRAAISGCAGSGKTALAIEKSSRLSRQGARVLLTCFNRFLAEHLATQTGGSEQIDVISFHKLALEWCRRAGTLDGHTPEDPAFFDSTLPDLFMRAIDLLGPGYDAVVVDEGQDFQSHWWIPVRCLLRDADHGFLYIFHDDNQNLYSAGGLPDDLPSFPLTVNLRNTQAIHRKVMRHYRSEIQPTPAGPAGRPAEVYAYQSAQDLRHLLRRTLLRLIEEEGIPPEDVVVLTPRSSRRSDLWSMRELASFRLTGDWSAGGADIFCTSVHSFKGLESPVVILAELDREASNDLDTLLYVAYSRAVHHLVILAHEDIVQVIGE